MVNRRLQKIVVSSNSAVYQCYNADLASIVLNSVSQNNIEQNS